ncbi:MAG TPA: methyltransferase domain-containing protein [Streptosporangiaceae bacterium]|nr:methyltransferase domain-containing protein [Streptosporangiaceae bacterium]
MLTPPAAGRREARPAAPRPVTPAPSAPAEAPADAPEEAGDWYQPAVPSAMPYEFPSTGSVRLIPSSGQGTGGRPARRPSTASTTGRAAVSPARPGPARSPSRSAHAATPPAGDAVEHAAPRYVIPGPPVPAPTAATDSGVTAHAPPGRASADRATPVISAATARPSAAGRAGTAPAVVPRLAGGELFGRHVRSYAAENSGQQITILQAGCTTAEDLGVDPLRAAGARLSVSMVDEDSEITRAAVARHQDMREAILGDLRTVPLPPRAYDIVQCSSLLGRIEHAELVLDRLSAAVKPGGLLLLRVRDRDSAAGFLDRVLPGLFRRAIWRKRQPGEPGPHVAVYERLASGRGVQAYVLMRGLVIAERGALGGPAGGLPRGPHGYRTAQKVVARLSRGRLTSGHEDLLYVIRKPEDRFARII